MRIKELFTTAKKSETTLFGGESMVSELIGVTQQTRSWLGYDSSRNPVAYFETEPAVNYSSIVSRVISVDSMRTKIPASGEVVSVLKVTCMERNLEQVFQKFIEAVLDKKPSKSDVVDVLHQATSEWRSLLLIINQEFPESKALGVFGELKFLEQLVSHQGAEALKYWQISAREIHDFIAPGIRVEVKTSGFQNKMAVNIHGLKQLTIPKNSKLTLAVADIQKYGNGETLTQVIENIESLGVDREIFHNKLAEAGVVLGMPVLDEFHFTLLSWRYWEINHGVPVLSTDTVSEQVRDAVSDLSYNLNLSALGHPADRFDWNQFQLEKVTNGVEA